MLTISTLTAIVLLIPLSTSDGAQRRTFTHAVAFQEVLAVIYETIGCVDVY